MSYDHKLYLLKEILTGNYHIKDFTNLKKKLFSIRARFLNRTGIQYMLDNLSPMLPLDCHLFNDASLRIPSVITKFFGDIKTAVWNHGKNIFFLYSICFIFELIRPANQCGLISRVRGTSFLLIYTLFVALFYAIFQNFWLGITPLFVIKFYWFSDLIFPLNMLNGIAAEILTLMLSDFIYYWFHRLQHSNKFLWRFHSVHHSVKELSVWNSYHHFTEELFRIPFYILPMTWLFHVDGGYIPLLFSLLIIVQVPFVHTATRVNFGIFRYILLDNKYHRIHHSIEKRYWNKNFSSLTPIWDILFKTAYFPAKNEWPNTGLIDIDEPKSISDFLWRPFYRQKTTLSTVYNQVRQA